jgi:ribose 5-phosphate isomerase B
MRIAFGTDEGTETARAVVEHLEAAGHDVVDPFAGCEWPEVGRGVAELVARGEADRGVVCCWTGTGVSIAANKVEGSGPRSAPTP